jgi:Tfp pilus assembly protein PilX
MFRRIFSNEKGNVMFMVLLCSVLITVLGVTSYFVATTELTESSHKYEEAKALYLAEGGLERAVLEMKTGVGNGWDDEVAGADGDIGTSDDGILSFGSQVDCFSNTHDQTTVDNTAVDGEGSSVWSRYLGYYDVRIVDGRRPGESPNKCNRVIIASEGISTRNAKRRVEAEVELWELQLPPAHVYIDGIYQDTDFNGNESTLDGKDTNPDGSAGPGPHVAAVLTTTWEVAEDVRDQVKLNQCDQILGYGNLYGTEPCYPSVYDLHQWNPTGFNPRKFKGKDLPKLESLVNNRISGGSYSTTLSIGAPDNYLITSCSGDLHLTGQFDGWGVLIVDGNFSMTGQGHWYGLIIVKGNTVHLSGGGTGFHLHGTLMCMGPGSLTDECDYRFCGSTDSAYSTHTINKVQESVRTVTVSRWRQLVSS